VSGYTKEIYRKLNVSSRAEAALTARNIGLV
jgi:DNA-binding NarL/FixJ family response regulator